MAHAQEHRTEFCIYFRVNNTVIDSVYSDNAVRMREIITTLRNIRQDSTINIVKVSFCGASSPEGSYQLNRKLARERLSSLEEFVRRKLDIPDSIITRNNSYIPWDYLKSQIKKSDLQSKDKVISILGEDPRLVGYRQGTHIDNRIVKLKQLDGGKVWRQLNSLFFPDMRNACAVLVTCKKAVPPVKEAETVPDTTIVEPEPVVDTVKVIPGPTDVVGTVLPEAERWQRRLYVKTNAVGWAMGITNLAAEADIAPHWSFTLPLYWSSWNYFKQTLKFRTLALQPEARYWFAEDNDGWFVGAHFGLAWYNFATGGDYRIQDHGGNSPALGGGIAAGYRLPVSRNMRWRMEFSLGGGVYKLHYDKFHNHKDGLLVETKKKTWFGIDRAAVSIAYTFDLGRKGGTR